MRSEGTGPVSQELNKRQDTRNRRTWHAFALQVEAVWQHLRHNWTDAILAVGFVAVIVLSAYALLRS